MPSLWLGSTRDKTRKQPKAGYRHCAAIEIATGGKCATWLESSRREPGGISALLLESLCGAQTTRVGAGVADLPAGVGGGGGPTGRSRLGGREHAAVPLGGLEEKGKVDAAKVVSGRSGGGGGRV